jgi:hypothetical protein
MNEYTYGQINNDTEKMERDSTYQDKSEMLLEMELKRMLNEGRRPNAREFRTWAEERGWNNHHDKKLKDYLIYKYSLPR